MEKYDYSSLDEQKLRAILKRYTNNLGILVEKSANYGELDTPLSIINQISKHQEIIETIHKEIDRRNKNTEKISILHKSIFSSRYIILLVTFILIIFLLYFFFVYRNNRKDLLIKLIPGHGCSSNIILSNDIDVYSYLIENGELPKINYPVDSNGIGPGRGRSGSLVVSLTNTSNKWLNIDKNILVSYYKKNAIMSLNDMNGLTFWGCGAGGVPILLENDINLSNSPKINEIFQTGEFEFISLEPGEFVWLIISFNCVETGVYNASIDVNYSYSDNNDSHNETYNIQMVCPISYTEWPAGVKGKDGLNLRREFIWVKDDYQEIPNPDRPEYLNK